MRTDETRTQISNMYCEITSLLLVFLSGCWCGALMRYYGLFSVNDILVSKPIYCVMKFVGIGNPMIGLSVLVGVLLCAVWLLSRRFLSNRYETANRECSLIWHLPLLLCVYLVSQWIGWNQIAFSGCKLGSLAEYVGVCSGNEAAVMVFGVEFCCAWAVLHCLVASRLKGRVCDLRMMVAVSVFLAVAAISRFRTPSQLHLHFNDFYCADRCYLTSVRAGDWWTFMETDDHIEFRGGSSMFSGVNDSENEKRISLICSRKYGLLVREDEEVYCSKAKEPSGEMVEKRIKFRVVASNVEGCTPVQLRLFCECSAGGEYKRVAFQEAIRILSGWNEMAAREISNSLARHSMIEVDTRNHFIDGDAP